MAITSRNAFNRTHRLEKGQFKVNKDDVEGRQAVADARKAVLNGDDDKAVSLLMLNGSIEIVDTTPAEIPDEPTVQMTSGRTTKDIPKSLIKMYRKDGWKLS